MILQKNNVTHLLYIYIILAHNTKGYKMKTNKILTKIVTLSLITASVLYARSLVQPNQISYQGMSIIELQEEVEVLSQEGDLPFDMGLELMKRWTTKS